MRHGCTERETSSIIKSGPWCLPILVELSSVQRRYVIYKLNAHRSLRVTTRLSPLSHVLNPFTGNTNKEKRLNRSSIYS